MEKDNGQAGEETQSERESIQKKSSPEKKMTGVGFYLVLSTVVLNDLVGLIADLSVVLFFVAVITGIIVQGIVALYLFWNGVKLSERKLASFLVSFIIEVIPFVNLLPAGTVNLLAIRAIENSETARTVAKYKKV